MRFITKLILRIIANALAIFLAARYVDQISFSGDWIDYLVIGLILALANMIIKPILKIVSAPLIFITMGLFLIVINGIIIFAVDWFVETLTINGIVGYAWAIIIVSVLNAIIVGSFKKKSKLIQE